MSFDLTIVDAAAKPVAAGLRLQLLRDGAIIAEGVTRGEGAVTFEAAVTAGDSLAVRIAPDTADTPPG